MAANASPAVPAPSRKTLLEWIESDDGNEPDITQASNQQLRFHAALVFAPREDQREPLTPPPGLALAPLG